MLAGGEAPVIKIATGRHGEEGATAAAAAQAGKEAAAAAVRPIGALAMDTAGAGLEASPTAEDTEDTATAATEAIQGGDRDTHSIITEVTYDFRLHFSTIAELLLLHRPVSDCLSNLS